MHGELAEGRLWKSQPPLSSPQHRQVPGVREISSPSLLIQMSKIKSDNSHPEDRESVRALRKSLPKIKTPRLTDPEPRKAGRTAGKVRSPLLGWQCSKPVTCFNALVLPNMRTVRSAAGTISEASFLTAGYAQEGGGRSRAPRWSTVWPALSLQSRRSPGGSEFWKNQPQTCPLSCMAARTGGPAGLEEERETELGPLRAARAPHPRTGQDRTSTAEPPQAAPLGLSSMSRLPGRAEEINA